MTTTIMTLGVSEPDLSAYANGLYASYGTTATRYARQRAMEFRSCGDSDGEAVWNRLADILSEQTGASGRQ
jgi:hypothetical protein